MPACRIIEIPPKVTPTPGVIPIDPRTERSKAKDYRQLVDLLMPLAKAGSPVAQYEVASALQYCNENWLARAYSSTTGAPRTPEELHRLYVKIGGNLQGLLIQADQRCQAFLGDVPILNTSNEWLDKAVAAGYAPAFFMKAELMFKTYLMNNDPAGIQQAREQAIIASTSGDAAVVFGMSDFVTGTEKTPERYGQLMSAWWLLGCERGFDCGADSEVIKNMCLEVDPQCANKPTLVEYIQRIQGANFDAVQLVKDQIKAAIDSRDPDEIQKYL